MAKNSRIAENNHVDTYVYGKCISEFKKHFSATCILSFTWSSKGIFDFSDFCLTRLRMINIQILIHLHIFEVCIIDVLLRIYALNMSDCQI